MSTRAASENRTPHLRCTGPTHRPLCLRGIFVPEERIELPFAGSEPDVLPLNDSGSGSGGGTRNLVAEFKVPLADLSSPERSAWRGSNPHLSGGNRACCHWNTTRAFRSPAGGTRTRTQRLKRTLLCLSSYGRRRVSPAAAFSSHAFTSVGAVGVEPTTNDLRDRCASNCARHPLPRPPLIDASRT